jgi:peptidoglycan/LPS O-acetylase OafA/YrhL
MDTSRASVAEVVRAKPYFAPIDGMRSLCVLLVVYNHLKAGLYAVTIVDGHLGVDIFFIISGFLISTLLLREEKTTGRIDLSAFYWRRAFRILPIYSVVLGAYVLLCQLPSQAAKWVQLKAGLPYFLLFLNEYVKEPSPGTVFTHTWSLGVEEKFYLFWPVLFFAVAKSAKARWVLLAVLFLATAVAPFFGMAFLARAYLGLLMGCLMGVLLDSRVGGAYCAMLRRMPSLVMLLVFLGGFYLVHLSKSYMAGFSTATVLFLSYLIVKPTWLSALFASRPLVWLGRRSYSMYLVHVLCLNAVEAKIKNNSAVSGIAMLTLGFALTAAVAAVLYATVEEPARLFGKRLIAKRRSRETAWLEVSS